jgi:hypothetical protein
VAELNSFIRDIIVRRREVRDKEKKSGLQERKYNCKLHNLVFAQRFYYFREDVLDRVLGAVEDAQWNDEHIDNVCDQVLELHCMHTYASVN